MTFSRSLRGALSHFRTHALTHSRTVLLLLLSAGALPVRAAAQDTPEQVVERYYQTFQSGDYAGNAALMHPGALEELKTTLLGMAALPGATEQPQFREMFGASGDWRTIVVERMQFPDGMAGAIREVWEKGSVKFRAAQGREPDPVEFTRQFVDSNFPH